MRIGSPSGRMRSVVLTISLAVNLLLVSAIAAYALRDRPAEGQDRHRSGIERLAERLPAEDGAKLRAAYAAHADELTALRADTRRLRDSVRQVLREEPFDPKAFGEAMAQLASRRAEMHRAFGRVIGEAAAKMTPDGRTALADRSHRRR